MPLKIKSDVLQALADWKDGKPVRSLDLGHVHRMKDNPGMCPSIDMSQHLHRDQERAHAYCFHIIEFFVGEGVPFPADFEAFSNCCDVLEAKFRMENEGSPVLTGADKLTTEELDGAESLAWKALLVGWRKAIDGHRDVDYIEVTREAVKAT